TPGLAPKLGPPEQQERLPPENRLEASKIFSSVPGAHAPGIKRGKILYLSVALLKASAALSFASLALFCRSDLAWSILPSALVDSSPVASPKASFALPLMSSIDICFLLKVGIFLCPIHGTEKPRTGQE